MFFDSHTHLNADELFENWQQHIAEFIAVGWKWLVNIGANDDRSRIAIEISQKAKTLFPSIFVGTAIGIHPSEIAYWTITWENIIEKQEALFQIYKDSTSEISAIWECGIDLHYPWATNTLQLQKELLARQCQLSLKTWLPLVIHSRDGFQETIEVLEKSFFSHAGNTPDVVFHCFWYWPEEAQFLIDNFENVYLWFDGNITYKSAQPLRDAFMLTPLNRVLLETDAPYLAPIPERGKTNTPKNIVHTYKFLAELRNIELEEFAKTIYENCCRFFRIPLSQTK